MHRLSPIPININQKPSSTGSSILYAQSCANSTPEPNPPFVFPLPPTVGEAPKPSELPIQGDAVRFRRAVNRPRPQQLSFHALPAFEFGVSDPCSAAALARSPDRSPVGIATSYFNSSGYRRNDNDFIGGESRSGGSESVSASPTKIQRALPTSSDPHTLTSANRRGHAHRRSGAVSHHDLSMILKPAPEPRGGSAPTTPAVSAVRPEFPPDLGRAASQPSVIISQPTSSSTDHQRSSSVEAQARPRVGFSDSIEFIPRPLSTISSETSSSLSTIRVNHSVTGSITSVMSTGTSSEVSGKLTRPALGPRLASDSPQPRPKSAGLITSNPQEDLPFYQKEAVLLRRPSSASMLERWSIEADTCSGQSAFKKGLTNEEPYGVLFSLPDPPPRDVKLVRFPKVSDDSDSQYIPQLTVNSTGSPRSRPRSSPEARIMKRQRKVKSWAGSILSRKAKHRDAKEKVTVRGSSTSPFLDLASQDEFSLENVNFDEDTTCVIETPSLRVATKSTAPSEFSTWKHYDSDIVSESDGSVSVLDLDAALANFKPPGPGDDTARGFTIARRKMHSSGATGGFSGPGLHYHRRTESAPEMAPMNYNAFGCPRLGSNPVMADVFEEEEEEDHNPVNGERAMLGGVSAIRDSATSGSSIRTNDVDSTETPSLDLSTSTKTDAIAMVDEVQLLSSTQPGNKSLISSPKPHDMPEELSRVEIVSLHEEPRASVVIKSSDESTITPKWSQDFMAPRPASAPIDLVISKPSVYAIPESSYIPSPDFTETSFDIPRMHTANSSITDRVTLNSYRTYEHGVSMRGSVDDVPSLISYASTLNSSQPHGFSGSLKARSSGDRSSALSTAQPGSNCSSSTNKRSSFASLSRLVGGSYGEKSKLNIAECASSDHSEKTPKKKGLRIPRLMRFWKPKDKLNFS